MTNSDTSDPVLIGIDFGSAIMKGALVSPAGEILHEMPVDTDSHDAKAALKQLIEVVNNLTHLADGRAKSIGISVPGLVDQKTHRIEMLTHLPDLTDFDIPAMVRDAAGLPCALDNEANAAAYAEHQAGAAKGKQEVFFVSLSATVGAGLILDGKIYRGANGFAGEFGHMTIDPEGIECSCGNVGCLETIASAPNIVRRMRSRLRRDRTSSLSTLAIPRDRELTAEDIAAAAKHGDEMSQLIMERTGMFLGIALAAVVNLLNLEMIVMGGGVMAAGDLILKPTISETRRRAFPPSFRGCEIVPASLGASAGVIGAALIGRDYAH